MVLKTKNIFSYFFNLFLDPTSNFADLKKKIIVIATLLGKLQAVKDLVRLLSKKHRFRTPFDSQHVKGFQTPAKSAWEHFKDIFSSL